MAFMFDFKGGVVKPTPHTVEKFLLFFVVNGREVPLYQMQQDNLVLKPFSEHPERFTSGNNVLKLFMYMGGFGVAKRYYSFYIRLFDDTAAVPSVTIRSLSLSPTDELFFKGKASFLKKSEVLNILDKKAQSRAFIQNQTLPPLDLLHKLITVDKSELKKGVRHIRVVRPKKGR